VKNQWQVSPNMLLRELAQENSLLKLVSTLIVRQMELHFPAQKPSRTLTAVPFTEVGGFIPMQTTTERSRCSEMYPRKNAKLYFVNALTN